MLVLASRGEVLECKEDTEILQESYQLKMIKHISHFPVLKNLPLHLLNARILHHKIWILNNFKPKILNLRK
jgi:hypothetical protein